MNIYEIIFSISFKILIYLFKSRKSLSITNTNNLRTCACIQFLRNPLNFMFLFNKNLQNYFLKNRSLLNCLFQSATSVISRMFFIMNKAKIFTPGFIMVLHTFRRDLKWNPHIQKAL